ncbi:Uncharacterized protein APZ42_014524 [Daphnia magna]|uniref:Uncharacterized protein n=1 Tax=Daphnia magna TaxID=35525 RepID=A0A162PUL2_9CRUS|nr:Uncharacterized protein APZ42_014524 [Daphnia magna]
MREYSSFCPSIGRQISMQRDVLNEFFPRTALLPTSIPALRVLHVQPTVSQESKASGDIV